MSYCRNNGEDSDVYVIGSRDWERRACLECFCGERDRNGYYVNPFPKFYRRTEMVTHLLGHLLRGDKVPIRAFDRLLEEIRTEGDEV